MVLLQVGLRACVDAGAEWDAFFWGDFMLRGVGCGELLASWRWKKNGLLGVRVKSIDILG